MGLKPGEKAQVSGQYLIIEPNGASTHREITAIKDKPLPPTLKPGQKYKLVDPTKNKSGRQKK